MRLGEIFEGLDVELPFGSKDKEISRVTDDSKEVGPNSLFICIRGLTTDGHYYAPEAVKKGAEVLVVEEELPLPGLQIKVENARSLLPYIARNFYGRPDRWLKLIGVTGTNGKSTVTHLISYVLEGLGERTLLLGTVNYMVCGRCFKAERTTPPPIQLWRFMREALDEGASYVVMEVSSHALVLERVESLEFDLSLFTNLSRDHLDFHLGMEDYYRAKSTLFTHHTKGIPVVNLDCPFGERLFKELDYSEKRGYTMEEKETTVCGSLLADSIEGVTLEVKEGPLHYLISSPLVGQHNASNLLAAFTSLRALEAPPNDLLPLLTSFSGLKGRLERVKNSKGIGVFVDYAHTPDALRVVMQSLREISKGRLIVVFGCGGDRDRGKRPIMGELASRMADLVVVTSDNPRSEDPLAIIREILQGVKGSGREVWTESDRREAIHRALEASSAGDVVLIAGKGHEDYQIVGDQVLPFSDVEVAREILGEMGWL